MNKINIILVEDEQEICDVIESKLTAEGFEVKSFKDGSHALEFIQDASPQNQRMDLFILDRMLPSINGLTICKNLRKLEHTKRTPILMLTALGTPEQIVEGLDAGADDYMTKPFDLNILMARIRSLLRRSDLVVKENQDSANFLIQNDLKIDLEQCKVWIGDQELDLTPSEYKILCRFMSTPGKVFTRNQLVQYVQDGPVHVTDRTIDTHIFGLRKKLGDHANMIETIRGIGYRVIR